MFFSPPYRLKRYDKIKSRATYTLNIILFLLFITLSHSVLADIQPRGSSHNYAKKSLSNAGNPAAAALTVKRKDSHAVIGGTIEFGAGIEYGDVDDLFAKIDALSSQFNPANNNDIEQPDPGTGDGGDSPEEGSLIGDKWDNYLQEHPELEDRLGIIEKKVAQSVAVFAVMKAEGYAKAEVTSDISFVLNDNIFGGTLLFGTSVKGNSKIIGVFDEVNFNIDQAKEELRKLPNFTQKDPIQTLKLSDGVILFYNPANHDSKLVFDNDSLVLAKATKTIDFSISYSNLVTGGESGNLYFGVKPILHRMGLTNASIRLGEITDTEELFDDIKNGNYIYENGFDTDLGLIWAANNYQIGATITNIFEHVYDFPELADNKSRSLSVTKQLSQHETYKMERQLKLEAGIYSSEKRWSLYSELDANAISDPMGDDYQWFTLTGGYVSNSWILTNAQLGYSRNLAGTTLGFINAGVTLFKYINLDAATTIDTVTLSGDKFLRGLNVRIGTQFSF